MTRIFPQSQSPSTETLKGFFCEPFICHTFIRHDVPTPFSRVSVRPAPAPGRSLAARVQPTFGNASSNNPVFNGVSVLLPDQSDKSICSAVDCDENVAVKGLCWKHYQRKRRYGNEEFIYRRYGLAHECRDCGTQNPEEFYTSYKSICKSCRKVRTIRRG